MNRSESDYIILCKKRIEEKLRLENGNGSLKQRDLEYLADCIEEKSGIKLSLSTLKRLWKEDYDQTPHPSTLQALISLLGYKDWQDFKLQETIETASPVLKKKKHTVSRWLVWPVLAAVPVLIWLIAFRSGKSQPAISGTFTFTGNKTISQGVPNTVIFNYDVTNLEADSFFFQQSWNDQERVLLDREGHYYSNIYYYPGFHKAKLIANDSILTRFPVHITTDGWLPLVTYSYKDAIPVYVHPDKAISDGALHITREELAADKVNIDKDYLLGYYNIREFENTFSDNFELDTRIVCDSSSTLPCPGFELVIVCEAHIFLVRMMGKGCERDIAVKMGEVYRDGINNDLSAFGRNLYQWQRLQVKVSDKTATIYLAEEPVYTVTFKEDFGKVVGLVYNFSGNGAVDFVRLKNGAGKEVYGEEFDGE